MAGIILLLGLCVIMALASFLAGALPLSMALSQTQLRLLSSIGVGILVGTSLIVIIPEGIEAAATPGESNHVHRIRTVIRRSPWDFALEPRSLENTFSDASVNQARSNQVLTHVVVERTDEVALPKRDVERQDDKSETIEPAPAIPSDDDDDSTGDHIGHDHDGEEFEVPTLEIGAAMIIGFILMFLLDRIPKHATEQFHSAPETQHMSMDNLGGNSGSVEEESVGFLGSMTPEPRHARSLATTTGLVIHAAADGIAMGASASSSDMKLGFIIFIAIMIHKAPAAFGLTSVLLKQGLSKRAARGHLIVFSLAAPVGALTTWLLVTLLGGGMDGEFGQWWTGMLLLFSGGTFLYVAMHAMQDDASHGHDHGPGMNGYSEGGSNIQRKSKGPQMRETLATVVGMLLPILTQIWHSH